MEITVNIPKNDYVQPTEVRQEVVQAICEAFLNGHEFCTNNAGLSSWVYRDSSGKMSFVWDCVQKHDIKNKGQKYYIPHGCEVNCAFKVLYDAGYFIFGMIFGATRYVCSNKPYYNGCEMVKEFTDFID